MKHTSIKLLIMDVDGTLTNGSINIGENGELFKSFNVKDGYGIADILPRCSILPAIITSRSSKIVEHRACELHISHLYQNVANKYTKLCSLLNELDLTFDNCAYIGDDINDLECMMKCKISACPADAVKEVKESVQYVCAHKGGDGAVREFIDYLKEL